MHRRMALASIALASSAALVATCAREVSEPIARSESAIVGGAPDATHRGVALVYAFRPDGSAEICTAVAIGPHALLTAKHCTMLEDAPGSCRFTALEPRALGVTVTANVHEGSEASFLVQEVLRTPGADVCADIADGSDLAVLLTGARIATEHFGIAPPREGAPATVVGFGRTRPGATDPMDYGVRHAAEVSIEDVTARRVTTSGSAWTCLGDSGSPLFDATGAVVGIASFRVGGDCADGPSLFARPDAETAMIADALAWEPTCDATERDEVSCNWLDDDCDGTFDEGCARLGDPCTSDEACSSAMCSTVGATRVCTRPCDPTATEPTCPFGYACIPIGDCTAGGCVVEGTPVDPSCAPDAGTPIEPADAAAPDASRPEPAVDAGPPPQPDAGPAHVPDGGCATTRARDAGPSSSSLLLALALVLVPWLRRRRWRVSR